MFENIRSDIERYRRYGHTASTLRLVIENQGLWAMICFRSYRHLTENPPPPVIKQLASAFCWIWWKLVQMTTGIYIAPSARIGRGFHVEHFGQIFIGADSTIGDDCNVAQGVTLGIAERHGKWGAPHLGNRVVITAGAKIIGPIHLADGTVVGANAVVTRDTEENATMVGIPAKAINYRGSDRFMGSR